MIDTIVLYFVKDEEFFSFMFIKLKICFYLNFHLLKTYL